MHKGGGRLRTRITQKPGQCAAKQALHLRDDPPASRQRAAHGDPGPPLMPAAPPLAHAAALGAAWLPPLRPCEPAAGAARQLPLGARAEAAGRRPQRSRAAAGRHRAATRAAPPPAPLPALARCSGWEQIRAQVPFNVLALCPVGMAVPCMSCIVACCSARHVNPLDPHWTACTCPPEVQQQQHSAVRSRALVGADKVLDAVGLQLAGGACACRGTGRWVKRRREGG